MRRVTRANRPARDPVGHSIMSTRAIRRVMVTAGLAALLLGVAGAGASALAGGGHGHGHFHGHGHGSFHGRVFIGPRVFVGPRFYVGPPYYPYPYGPYYYTPPPVVVTPPTTYIERPSAEAYWYYCQNPAGYYPQISQCPGGWIQVAPRSE
jgi:hypothetical protein